MNFFIRFYSRRCLSTLIDVGSQMKKLNDTGQFKKTIALYDDQIEKQNKQSTSLVVNQALKACIELNDIERGKHIHKNLSSYMANNSFIQASLIRLYIQCGDYETSEQIFKKSNNKTTVMFNYILKGLVDNNRCEEALNLFRQMKIPTNEYTLSILFKICTDLADQRSLEFGQSVFDKMPKTYHNNIVVISSALQMFIKCGDIAKAEELFNRIEKKNSFTYSIMMNGFILNKLEERAIDLFFKIQEPNEIIFTILFNACAQLKTKKALNLGKKVFDQLAIDSNQSNDLLYSVLNMFIKCDDLKSAESLFDRMPKTYHDDIVIINSALQMFIKCGDIAKAEELFNRIEKKNLFTYSIMMNGFILSKVEERAIDLFFKIQEPDEIILSILFNACAQLKTEKALNLGKKVFDQLVIECNQSHDSLHMALNMFIKCDDLKSAEALFHQMNRNIISYGSMMKFYNIKDQPEKTLELFQKMKQENLIPNEICYVLLIDALSVIGDLSLCQSLLCEIPEHFLIDPWIQVGLIDLWGKIGSPDKSKEIFDKIDHPNSSAFGAMINAYGLNGMGFEAVELFNKVPSDMLASVHYICVLNACSHSGLIDQAWKIFENIPLNQRREQIYTTMIDTTSRVFLFDQALQLVDEYEKSHNPSIPMYMSILSSARNAKDISLSEKIFRRIESNFANNKNCLVSAGILLANTYALSGNKSMASNVRMQLHQSNTKKVVGYAWTVVDEKVHKFRAHDRSHAYSSEIYDESERLLERLIERGYKPDESWITRGLNNDETTESVLCGHSERLAIIFNLIQRPIPTRIQVVKNLRVCGDCHLVTKMIAEIYQCVIIVRDANRIHHFYPNGKCSCNDHF